MSEESENLDPKLDKDDKLGMLVVLAFLVGLPVLGILYAMFFGGPSK